MLRAGQQIALAGSVEQGAVAVVAGCMKLDAILMGEQRQTVLLLYPGDVLSRRLSPSLPGAVLTAAMASEIADLHGQGPDGAEVAGTPQLLARAALHGFSVARLTAVQKLATFLIEMALHLGQDAPGGRVFPMPLPRQAIAEHIGVNPDTLSRLMTRLKARRILSSPTRSRIIVTDMDGLLAMSPLATAMRQLAAARLPALPK
jgi:CRP/FNR family transcriptional regulator